MVAFVGVDGLQVSTAEAKARPKAKPKAKPASRAKAKATRSSREM